MSTKSLKASEVERGWFVVDAQGKTLGRLAAKVASVIRGKHRPEYTPHVDTGEFVIVINAEKVHLTGNKLDGKFAYHHSGFPGGLKSTPYRKLIEDKPAFVIEKAVKGMLPKNRLGRKLHTRLKVYAGENHPHVAQKPQPLAI